MKTTLHFDFSVHKEDNTIRITREFAAHLDKVWDAWTKPEILDQWWAPKPYRTVTKSMEFREGGRGLYGMISPEDEKHWCRADYKTIKNTSLITWLDAFCDENGNDNSGKPGSFWTIQFTESKGITTVNISLKHDSPADLDMMLEMGFKEGFTMAVGNLDEVLMEN